MSDNKLCTGCGACKNVCPLNCIEIKIANNGYIYTSKDEKRCIHCNKCEKVCPLNKKGSEKNEMLNAYLFINADSYDRNLSSSGGFFKALADYVIDEKKGICYGAAFSRDLGVHHIGIENKDDLYMILGSKYVQSNMEECYRTIKSQLESKRFVLFSGTPCQVAALKSYLDNIEYSNLITVDIFCHGVPSEKIWKKYLEEKFGNEEIRYIQFRDKTLGWWQFRFRVQLAHSEYASFYRPPSDAYIKCFLKDISINQCCFECIYRTRKKHSDFFIGDAWNINKIKMNMDDNRGVTSVVTNSIVAEEIMGILSKKHHVFEVGLEDGVFTRTELFSNKKIPIERKKFWDGLEDGIENIVEEIKI